MNRPKYQNSIRVTLQCRCGKWLRYQGSKCVACEVREERKDAATVRRRLRQRLDPGANYDEHGRPAV